METINLLNGNEFCPSRDIYKRLEEGVKAHSLIYTDNMRGIGKTTGLIEFAKDHDYIVILHSTKLECEKLKKEFNYKYICPFAYVDFRGSRMKYVIDEGTSTDYRLLSESKIITGFTNVKPITGTLTIGGNNGIMQVSNSKESFTDKILKGLKSDAESLSDKLSKNDNNSDYKMMINNLKTTMELINELEGNVNPTTVNISNVELPSVIDSEDFLNKLIQMTHVNS